MARVRLKSPTMKNFSSFMGVTEFKDGVSVDHVSHREAQLLGSITGVEFIDDDGNATGNAGMAQVQVDGRSNAAPVEAKKIMASDTFNTPAEINAKDVTVTAPAPTVDDLDAAADDLDEEVTKIEAAEAADKPEGETSDAAVVYSRADLEEIADKEGITGIRAIGDTLGQRSNSIESLIDKILKAQV